MLYNIVIGAIALLMCAIFFDQCIPGERTLFRLTVKKNCHANLSNDWQLKHDEITGKYIMVYQECKFLSWHYSYIPGPGDVYIPPDYGYTYDLNPVWNNAISDKDTCILKAMVVLFIEERAEVEKREMNPYQ